MNQALEKVAKASAQDVVIRLAGPQDEAAVWWIFEAVIATGDTYTYLPTTTREQAQRMWDADPRTRYVAEYKGKVCGFYDLKPNARGLGAHVANAGYMIHPEFQNRGIGVLMGQHSIEQARTQGYKAMQFNMVVSTNARAVSRWKLLGFEIIGTIPKAFQHQTHGLVDAHVMYRAL